MSDAEPSSVPPVPISDHSRVLIAMHKAMRADSRRLITAVDALPAGDTQQAAALGRAFALLEEAAAFDRVLVDHLDREEAVVVPPFESLLSEADQHALQKEEAKLSTYGHMRMAVPWVLANATPEEEASLRTTAPRLLGVIQDRVWEPRFARAMAPLYQSTQD
jgi:Hemerythrin HHE cation binding domain